MRICLKEDWSIRDLADEPLSLFAKSIIRCPKRTRRLWAYSMGNPRRFTPDGYSLPTLINTRPATSTWMYPVTAQRRTIGSEIWKLVYVINIPGTVAIRK